jgi:signal peptidase I
MTPTIRDGDRILVAPLSRAPHVGDVVEYERENGVSVHRVVASRRDRSGIVVFVRGDASDESAECVSMTRVIGRVVAVENNGIVHRLDGWRGRAAGIARVLKRRLRSARSR